MQCVCVSVSVCERERERERERMSLNVTNTFWLLLLNLGPGNVLFSYETGFYKPTILIVHPPISMMTT